MTRELTEDGPRLELHFSDDELENLEEGLRAADYTPWNRESTRETRFRHPGGSTVRIFPLVGLAYVYPPGGTAHQTGPIHPFSPLKRECAAANGAAGFVVHEGDDLQPDGDDAASSSSSSSADDAGAGDPPTEDEEGDDGDDE